MIDLLVAGGGPAGLAAAIRAARLGLETVVVEPRASPIDKACGEGIMPSGVAALRALGVEVTGHRLRGIRYVEGARSAEAAFRGRTGLGVRRTELHSALHGRAVELGVRIVPGKVADVRQSEDRVSAGGLTARWMIAADGLHSPLRRELGLDGPGTAVRRYGQRRHYRIAPWTEFVEVHWSRHGEAYVTPLGDGLVGVAVLSGERRSYEEHLTAFPRLAASLSGRDAGPVRGAGPLRRRALGRRAGRVLLAGDAAGYVDALTGEGVALALATAAAAVDSLAAGRPQDYPPRWTRLTRRHRLLTEGLLAVARHPATARLIVPAAYRAPAVFGAAVHALQ
ncbi:FAD-dependent monooxygenase [Streptomyces sp. NBC_01260]|uniref:NAD(P)/FAD-dependent oxidoreductase n=1 Tax=unclassified Streptomyces TaxID=2593676 RepID=UPI000F4A2027|nr:MULTISPECIES: FAD-dependent monooxygenase [unclassified Streptomyces]ROQ72886.1 flavin-dependent dehydrogenase [Streptomyces sp. CEV 2-1]RPK35231.1 putative oxidoreductase [Streptomyces sp. ADI92-24]